MGSLGKVNAIASENPPLQLRLSGLDLTRQVAPGSSFPVSISIDGAWPDQFDRFSPPIAVCHNPNGGNGEAMHQDRLSHALPTSDLDLAFIVGLWDRLADQIKARLLDVIRENLPT